MIFTRTSTLPVIKLHNPISRAHDHQSTKAAASEYSSLYNEKQGANADKRKQKYMTLVNHYYDLVTDFYEYGWGHSFHFATHRKGESFDDAIARHERHLAQGIGLKPGMKTLDVGCGIGGPLREIARTSGANIVGLNNNDYQLKKMETYNQKAGIDHRCSGLKGDFMNIPAKANSFDAAYAIEATCHAPDRVGVYKEIFRVLKPGARFGGYEWCMTEVFDPNNLQQQRIKKGVEEGDALPDIISTHRIIQALKDAGFNVIEARDMAPESDPDKPWYSPLDAQELSIRSLPRTPLGRVLTQRAMRLLEMVGIAPKGTAEVSKFLNLGADSLVEAGKLGIFTPMFYFVAEKPKPKRKRNRKKKAA